MIDGAAACRAAACCLVARRAAPPPATPPPSKPHCAPTRPTKMSRSQLMPHLHEHTKHAAVRILCTWCEGGQACGSWANAHRCTLRRVHRRQLEDDAPRHDGHSCPSRRSTSFQRLRCVFAALFAQPLCCTRTCLRPVRSCWRPLRSCWRPLRSRLSRRLPKATCSAVPLMYREQAQNDGQPDSWSRRNAWLRAACSEGSSEAILTARCANAGYAALRE